MLVDFGGKKIVGLGLGMSRLGSTNNFSEAHIANRFRVMDELSEIGNVLLDTSPLYGGGFSETQLGHALSKRSDKFVIATKLYPGTGQTKRQVMQSVKLSLARLKIEKIDLIQVHWTHPSPNLSETFEALETLKTEGSLGEVGLSGFSKLEISELFRDNPQLVLLSNQVEVNLGNISLLREWRHNDIPWTIGFGVLLQGRLTYTEVHRNYLTEVAASVGVSAAALAVVSVAHSEKNLLPLVRVSNSRHMKEILHSYRMSLNSGMPDFKSLRDEPRITYLNPKAIRLEGDGFRKPYKSIFSALANPLDLIPSPFAMSQRFRRKTAFLPLHVNRQKDGTVQIDTKDPMSEVKRYWAWRLATPWRRIPVIEIEIEEEGG